MQIVHTGHTMMTIQSFYSSEVADGVMIVAFFTVNRTFLLFRTLSDLLQMSFIGSFFLLPCNVVMVWSENSSFGRIFSGDDRLFLSNKINRHDSFL